MPKENMPTIDEAMEKKNKKREEEKNSKKKVLDEAKATEEKKSPEGFDARDRKEIEKLAYFIFEHRMSDDPKRQKERAKEYGLDEKAFLKDTIEDIELPSGKKIKDIKWTPEAQKFMQDWDWKKAEEIYRDQTK